jgi:MarR family transcriptional regulator, organic hydroperoxide resistance regulator
LVTRTSSDPNTLRAMLVLLERGHLIERRPHPTDGRARSVALTQQGKSVFQKLWRKSDILRQRLATALSAEETELLIEQLHRIAIAMSIERTDSSDVRKRLTVDRRI